MIAYNMAQKARTLIVYCFFFLALNSMLYAQKKDLFVINNDDITVIYNANSNQLSLKNRLGKVFSECQLTEEQENKVKNIDNHQIPGIGMCRSIEIATAKGVTKIISVFPAIPFVFIETKIANTTNTELKIDKFDVFSAKVLPDVAAEKLSVLGTGGLTKMNEQPNTRLRHKGAKPKEANASAPGGSYMFLSVAEPESRNGIVGGWISSDRGSGIMYYYQDGKSACIKAGIDYGRLIVPAKTVVSTEVLALGYFQDCRLGLESYADMVARYYQIHLPAKMEGYCTWYSRPNGGASDEQKILVLAKDAVKKLKPYGFDFVQIDDKWQLGQYSNGPRKVFTGHRTDGPYPHGMKAVAHAINDIGLVPGIWWMPFAGTLDDPFFADKQYLFAKNKDQTPYVTKWGGTAFDLTSPKTLAYIGDISSRIAKDWGYKYFKMDGLWMGTATKNQYGNNGYEGDDDLGRQEVVNPNITPIESYRLGLKTIRKSAGKDVFLLGCNIAQNMRSFGASFGLFDAMRIGPDNKPVWNSLTVGPWHGANRYFLNGKVWYNDPDPLYIRNEMPLEHAQSICSWVAVSGQLNVFSEWLPELQPERVHLLQRTLPSHNLVARPADFFEEYFPRIWVLDNPLSDQKLVGVFNWSEKEPLNLRYAVEKLGLISDKTYETYEYWTNTFTEIKDGTLKAEISGGSCRVFSIRERKDFPQLISTSRHITQGIVEVKQEKWDVKNKSLSLQTENVAGDDFEIRIVVPKNMKAREVVFNGKVIPFSMAGQLLKANGTSGTNGLFNWTISFI